MKKFTLFAIAALLLAAPTVFTSCDDPWYDYYDDPYYDYWWDPYDDGGWGWNNDYYDDGDDNDNWGDQLSEEAEALQGEWDGIMKYTNGDNGEVNQFNASMTFVRNSSTAIKGTGTEIDYTLDNKNNITDEQRLNFNWYLDDETGDIHIKYLGDNKLEFVMDASAKERGFSLTDGQYFEGYMLGTNNNDMIYIDLKAVQNNSAKTRTAAAQPKTFGSTNIEKLNVSGLHKLNNRR